MPSMGMIDVIVDQSKEPRRGPVAVVDPAHEAAENLIRNHWAPLRRYLRILGADADAAEDLSQDVFVVALRKGLEDRGGRTAAWLRRTARFLFLDHARKRRPISLEVAAEVWEQHGSHDAERQRALRACIPLLTERSQTALAYGDRQSWAEIGLALGMQASGIKTLLRRCRATLKECIERATTSTPEASQ